MRRFFSPRASRVYKFRYENPDWLTPNGTPHYREISAVAGEGRFKMGSQEEAQGLAERRLSEQFGSALLQREETMKEQSPDFMDEAAERVREEPRLHQDNYHLVSVQRIK